MANLNISGVMQKVDKFTISANGKERMRDCVQQYAHSGQSKTAAGGKVITDKDMEIAAAKMISVLRSTAESYALPSSVMRLFDAISTSEIIRNSDGSSMIYVRFGGDRKRPSLRPDDYDGVENIIALLNNGYHAKHYVYGDWEGHSSSGQSVFDGRSIDTSAYIRSRKDREGLGFIQQAIRDFNGNYGADYNVTAIAGEDYANG